MLALGEFIVRLLSDLLKEISLPPFSRSNTHQVLNVAGPLLPALGEVVMRASCGLGDQEAYFSWVAAYRQCCGTGTVGTVTFCRAEPEP